ncbi:MAG: tyrosine-protein phosphatase [Acidobacteriota bacterium]
MDARVPLAPASSVQPRVTLIDTHSHLLPGIDDGSPSLDESVALCRIAAEDGIRTCVCTPHINFRYANSRETIETPFELLRARLRSEEIPLEIVGGAEVHMAPDILDKLKRKDLVTYNDMGRYLLLEFPFQQVLTGGEEMIYRLRLEGVTPVIAHPERIAYFMEDPGRLFNLIRLGALGQVTGGSLLGQFGEKCEAVGFTMIERRLVHVVASDAHDGSYRRPVLSDAAETIAKRFGMARSRAMTEEIPAAIVEGRDIETSEPLPAPPKFWRLFGFLSRGSKA